VENYIQRARARTDQRLTESAAFFQGEVERARQTIEGLENQKLTFEIQHADLLPDSPNGVQSGLADLRVELTELERQRDAAKLRAESLEETLAASPAMVAVSAGAGVAGNPLEQELRQAEGQLSESLTTLRMTERHPDVVALRQKIAAIRQRMEQTTASAVVPAAVMTPNPKRQELELLLTKAKADIEAYEKGRQQLQARLQTANSQSEQLFPVRAEYQKLTRRIEDAQRQLSFWEDNLRRVQVVQAAESGDRGLRLRFLKPAGVEAQPVSPRMSQVLAAAMLLSLAAGALAVFLGHQTDETFRRTSDLAEATSLPIFGTISEIASAQQRRLRQLRCLVLYPLNAAAMAALVALMVAVVYYSLHRPATPIRPAQQAAAPAAQAAAAPALSAVQGRE
jgi:polysaccharide biosynthesis transport protein